MKFSYRVRVQRRAALPQIIIGIVLIINTKLRMPISTNTILVLCTFSQIPIFTNCKKRCHKCCEVRRTYRYKR